MIKQPAYGHTFTMIWLSLLSFCMVEISHGQWSIETTDSLLNDGILIKASNLGDGAQPQTIDDIEFDIDYSLITGADPASDAWADKFYDGDDPARANLLNTGGKVSEWNATNMVFTFSNLHVGHPYRFQLLIGGAWNGAGANLYGNNWSEYRYIGLKGDTPKRAVYTWVADATERIIRTNAGAGQGNHFNLAYALHDLAQLTPDINNDCFVDFLDYFSLSHNWLRSCALTDDWCGLSDITRNGRVDIEDIAVLKDNWLESTLPGLVAWWKLDEPAGPLACDKSGHHDGLVSNIETIDRQPVNNGYALDLDAQREPDHLGEYVAVPRVIQDDFTLSLWLRTTNTGNEQLPNWWTGKGILTAGNYQAVNNFGLTLKGNAVAFGVGETGAGDVTIKSTVPVNDGHWHHIAITRNAVSGEVKIYIDGEPDITAFASTGSKDALPEILIGSVNRESGKFFGGRFDDIRLFDTVLIEDQIARLADKNYPYKTSKKGFGMVTSRWPGPDWMQCLYDLGVSWFYGWGLEALAYPDGIEFVPMKWGGKFTGDTVNKIQTAKQYGIANYLLGFNEPDGEDQANMTVQAAIDKWPDLMSFGLPLVSPACVHPDNDWMQSFMTEADNRGYRIDYVAVHWYGGGNADGFMNKLQTTYNLYGRPLWITEFAVADWGADQNNPNHHSPDKIYTFMAEVLYRLEKTEYVKRYAWFTSAPSPYTPLGTSALFEEDWAALTPLGRLYASWDGDIDGPNPDQWYYLNHESSLQRLRCPDGVSLATGPIDNLGAKVQWQLIEADNGVYFIANKDYHKRLHYDNDTGLLRLVSNAVADDNAKWTLTHAEHGWYLIDHLNSGKRLHFRTDISTVNVVEPIYNDANVKWRFIRH